MNDITSTVMKEIDVNSEKYFVSLNDYVQIELTERCTEVKQSKKTKAIASRKLNAVTAESSGIDDAIWQEIKKEKGIFNDGDFDFFVWTEEVSDSSLSSDAVGLINQILMEHQGIDVHIINFR